MDNHRNNRSLSLDEDDLALVAYISVGAAATPLIWAHFQTGFNGWDINGSGSFTVSDLGLYAGYFLSASWAFISSHMPGLFEFLEFPKYENPTIYTSIVGGLLLLASMVAILFLPMLFFAMLTRKPD